MRDKETLLKLMLRNQLDHFPSQESNNTVGTAQSIFCVVGLQKHHPHAVIG